MTGVAAIDVHKRRSTLGLVSVPGAKRGTRKTDGPLEFRTFYGVLQAMARELRGRGVTHVVMEALRGVHPDPVQPTRCARPGL